MIATAMLFVVDGVEITTLMGIIGMIHLTANGKKKKDLSVLFLYLHPRTESNRIIRIWNPAHRRQCFRDIICTFCFLGGAPQSG